MSNEKREKEMMAAADRYADEVCDESCTGAQAAETINDFCAGWRAADSHPAWVSVEDELPKEKGAYLFHFDDGQTRVEGYFPDLHLSKCVTHWMEIVPPVKKGGEE